MRPTEYTIAYKTTKGIIDIIYNLKTKTQAMKEAKKLYQEGCREIYIDIHCGDDIIDDINFDKVMRKGVGK